MAKTLRYTALGDSLTVGVGALSGEAWVNRYAMEIERQYSCKVIVHPAGFNGATTAELLAHMERSEQIQQWVREAHLISITAGGNDWLRAAQRFMLSSDPQGLKLQFKETMKDMKKLLQYIQELKQSGTESSKILIMNLYNPLPFFEETTFWVNKHNSALETLQNHVVQIGDAYSHFYGRENELLAEDGIHPNERGYEIIAQAMLALSIDSL